MQMTWPIGQEAANELQVQARVSKVLGLMEWSDVRTVVDIGFRSPFLYQALTAFNPAVEYWGIDGDPHNVTIASALHYDCAWHCSSWPDGPLDDLPLEPDVLVLMNLNWREDNGAIAHVNALEWVLRAGSEPKRLLISNCCTPPEPDYRKWLEYDVRDFRRLMPDLAVTHSVQLGNGYHALMERK